MDSLAFDALENAVAEQATGDANRVNVEQSVSVGNNGGVASGGRVTIADWRFKLGQCISHKEQSLPSLVMSRIRTAKGREVYGVRSFLNVDPNRDRMILGECLVDVVPGSGPCLGCLLLDTGMCPNEKQGI